LVVADVCAGAGMLGLEALSRGATFTYFVDKSSKAIEYIKNSLLLLEMPQSNYYLNTLDAIQFINHIAYSQNSIEKNTPKIDLLFLDPPYNTNIVNQILIQINDHNILSEKGIIVAETSIQNNLLIDNFILLTERQFGASKVFFISKKNH
jgi:16S rRNA (guanine(966)-N(2))-methyltransferase RsmD